MNKILLLTKNPKTRDLIKKSAEKLSNGGGQVIDISDLNELYTHLQKDPSSAVCIHWSVGKNSVKQITHSLLRDYIASYQNILILFREYNGEGLRFVIDNHIQSFIFSEETEDICRHLSKIFRKPEAERRRDVNIRRINTKIRDNQYDTSIKELTDLMSREPCHEYRINLALVHFYNGNYDRANELVIDQLNRKQLLRAIDLKARLLIKDGLYNEAAQIMYKAPEFRSANSIHLNAVANLYTATQEAEIALAEIASLGMVTYDQLLAKTSEADIQVDTFDTIVNFLQSSIRDIDKASVFNNIATIADKKGKYQIAIRYYITAYIFGGNDEKLTKKVIHNLAVAQCRIERFHEAIESYKFLLERDSKNEKAAHNLKIARSLLTKQERLSIAKKRA